MIIAMSSIFFFFFGKQLLQKARRNLLARPSLVSPKLAGSLGSLA